MKFLHAISLGGALVLQSAACSSSGSMGSGDGGAGDMGSIALPPGTPVNGTDSTTYILDSGSTVVENDLTANLIAALVPNVLGGFTTVAGQGKADGTFTIPNVPMGTYYLQYGFPSFPYNYLVTSDHQLDFGSETLGRQDVSYSAATTTFSPMLTGLAPWGAKDHIEMLAPNASAYCYSISDQASAPMAAATTLTAAKLNYQNFFYPGPLIDGAKGDLAYIFQLSTQMSPSLGAYTALTNSLLLPANFALVNAQDNSVMGALTPVTQSTFSTHYAISQFEQQVTAGTPTAKIAGTELLLESQPGGLAYGPFATSADLLEQGSMPGTADTDTGALSYGNPFPSSWGTYVNVITEFAVSYTLPGAPSPLTVPGSVVYAADASMLGSAGLTPAVGPVRNIKVNGKAATGVVTGTTATPTISFDPPVLGAAHSYLITLGAVVVSGNTLQAQTVAQFRTQGTSITVPAGPLTAGDVYVLTITAQYAPKDSFSAPLRLHFPRGSAPSIAAVLEP